MILFEDLPYASERMGILWTLGTIRGACVLEFGPEGSTHYAAAQHGTYNAPMRADLYTTGLTENEVVFGDPGRLETAVRELIDNRHPSHLFIIPSAVSEITGMDMDGICLALSRETPTRVIPFSGISLSSEHTQGVRRALSMVAKTVVRQAPSVEMTTYNIIGPGMDCCNYLADIREIERLMAGAFGYTAAAIFTADTSMEELSIAGKAAFNIVLRNEGIPCAKILKNRFGQPYYYKAPYGIAGTLSWIESVAEITGRSPSAVFLEKEAKTISEFRQRLDYQKRIAGHRTLSFVICGPYDLLKGLAPFIRDELGFHVSALVLTHPIPEYMPSAFNFFKNDSLKYEFIANAAPDYLLADAVTLRHFKGQIPGLQVSNPNLGMVKRFAWTPFMGFRGVQVLAQDFANLILP